jgi:hypothetical protein
MPKFKNIHDAIRNNERKECSVPSCRKPRYRISSFCENCGRQRWYWGHPEARGISKRQYLTEIHLVQQVIEKNPDHDGIGHGIQFLDNYMKRAANGATYIPGFKHTARLHDAGVDAKDVLVELGALYMLSWNHHTPVKDHRHLKYLLGNKFIRFVPCYERVKGTENRDVGEYLNENLGVLLLNISGAARKLEQAQGEEASQGC